MDTKQLELKLQPFKKQCEAEGFCIANIIVEEVPEGLGNAYYVDVCIPSITVDNYLEIRDRTFEILLETTDDDTLRYVFTYCVVDECEADVKHCCPVTAPELEHA